MNKLSTVIIIFSPLCTAMDVPKNPSQTEQSTTAPSTSSSTSISSTSSLDSIRVLNFIADVLPQEMQDPFVQKIDAAECGKIITNFEKDHQNLYSQALVAITQKEALLTSEEKKDIVIQMLAYGFMYRSGTSKGHKAAKKISMQKTQTAQKTSVATAIVSGIITVLTNLLQHFLSKN